MNGETVASDVIMCDLRMSIAVLAVGLSGVLTNAHRGDRVMLSNGRCWS